MANSWLQDGRNYKKLVNDGVLRSFKCTLCNKRLKPATFQVRDSPINHKLKYSDLIPVSCHKLSDTLWSQSYYLGLPSGFSLNAPTDWSTDLDHFEKLICSRKCPKLNSLATKCEAIARAEYGEVFDGFKTCWMRVDVEYSLFRPIIASGAALKAAAGDNSTQAFIESTKKRLERGPWISFHWPLTTLNANHLQQIEVVRFLEWCQETTYPSITFSDSYNAQSV